MSTYLITGGAGSLGREIVDILISKGEKVRAFDNCESGLAELVNKHPPALFTAVYGDVRDYTRVHYAMEGCDVVIHAAAMKNLDVTESNAPEMILTNVNGSANIAKAAAECGVECCVLISTDKAAEPRSAYGASKLLAEQLWLKCYARQGRKTRFIVFRSGNFKQSAGNVLEVWDRQIARGDSPTITDPDMERYFIDTRKAAALVCEVAQWARNGDTVIPKMELMKILDLLQEQHPGTSYRLIGKRSGEKLAERLMTDDEQVIWQDNEVMIVA